MNFSEIRQNYPVYILNRNSMKTTQGKVINAGSPYFPNMNPMNMPMPGQPQQNTQRMVDITIEIGGKTQTFTIPETSAVTCAQINGNEMILSTEKQGIIREVEVMKSQSEGVLASMEKHKAIIQNCDRILTEWNPQFAEKKEQDARIKTVEDKVDRLCVMMEKYFEKQQPTK